MRGDDGVVARVISLAKLPGAKRRSEVEKELRAHLEDIAEETRCQGYDESAVTRIVAMRFGEPRMIAAAFASVYAPERLARRIFGLAVLLMASVGTVVLVIGSVQLLAALCAATSIASVVRGIRWEFLGFGAISLGYCSVYLGQRLFPNSVAKALLPSAALALWVAAGLAWLKPPYAALPLVAFLCAAFGRLLQRVDIPFFWLAGTAAPLLIAWALFGPLIPGWQFPWLVWLGLTLSCKMLREVVQLLDRFVFSESFV